MVVDQAIACFAFLAGLLSTIGYIYAVPEIENARHYLTGMAFPTGVATMALAMGALLLRPAVGLVRPLATNDLIGSQSRRLLAAAILLPLSVGSALLTAHRHGLVGTELGAAVFAIAHITAFAVLVWWSARPLRSAETERRTARTHVYRIVRFPLLEPSGRAYGLGASILLSRVQTLLSA